MSISPINSGRTQKFAENFSVNVAAAGAGVVIATIMVPAKARMRLLELGNYISVVAAWGLITWHLNCNGIPCAPYGAFLDQIGYGAQREDTENLEFGGASRIEVTADNAHAAIVAVGVSMAYEFIYQE